MPRRKAAADRAEVECAAPDCSVRFSPERSTAKYHSATCRQRAGRARKAAEREAAEAAKSGTDAEHGLVKAVRIALEAAGKLSTVNGQLALELARRAVNPESNLVSMSKELDARLTAALGVKAAAVAEPEPADDDVTKARKARDRKRAAAGEAPTR
jgi:hypothetical protein